MVKNKTKKTQKCTLEHKIALFILNSPHDVIYSKGRHRENITDQKLSKEHIARVSNKEQEQSYYFNSDGLILAGFFYFRT